MIRRKKHPRQTAFGIAVILTLGLIFGIPFMPALEAHAYKLLSERQISPTQKEVSVYVDNVSKTYNHKLDDGSVYYCGGTYEENDKDVSHITYEYSDSEGYSGTLGNARGEKTSDTTGTCPFCPEYSWSIQIWDATYSGVVTRANPNASPAPSAAPSSTPTPTPTPPPGYLSIQSISPTTYTQNSVGTASVTVRNTGGRSKTGIVSFKGPLDNTQGKSVTLAPGASSTVTFNFRVPTPGAFNLSASADDSKTQPCTAIGTVYSPPPDSAVVDTITWTEDDSHTVTYEITDGDGNTRTASYQCVHNYTYRAVASPTLTLTPSTLKSGYGFSVDTRVTVSTSLIAQGGGCSRTVSRANTLTAAPPSQAEVRVNWTVTMRMKNNTLQTQQRNTKLEQSGSTSNSVNYQAPKSNISETGERKIYTDVSLAGTAQRPVQHPVTVWYGGGGIASRNLRFDFTTSKTITINGDMYEDDHTG